MNSLTSSISKMMQRPHPPPPPLPAAKTTEPAGADKTSIVVDSDSGTTEPDLGSMQPSTSYASRVPAPAGHAQARTLGLGDGSASGMTSGPPTSSSSSSSLRRPTLVRGGSGPDAPELGPGQTRPTARAMAVSGVGNTVQGQGQAGEEGGDQVPGAVPKAKVGPCSLSFHMLLLTDHVAFILSKPQQFDFHYEDSSDILSELSEFFPYAEMSHLLDNLHEFQIDVGQDAKWTEEDLAARRNYVQMQVEWLEHRDLEERMKAARRLTYLVQGEPSPGVHDRVPRGKLIPLHSR